MRFYAGLVLTAVVLFGWGAFYWVVLPAKFGVIRYLPADHPVAKALVEHRLETAVYFYPGYAPEKTIDSEEAGKAAMKEFQEKHKNGPLVSLMYRHPGIDMERPDTFIQGFMHMLLSAALFGTLTRCTVSWCNFACRYGFIVALGVIAAIWIDLSVPIWFHFPWDYQLFLALYHVSAWAVAGVPLAWATRGTPIVLPEARG